MLNKSEKEPAIVSPIIPYGKYILVKPNEGDEKTKAGVYVAGGEKDRTESIAIKGVIFALPKGYKGELKIGVKVLAAKWEAQKANVDAKNYILVKEKDILGIIK